MFDRLEFLKTPIAIREELLTLFAPDESVTVFDIGACEAEDSVRYSHLFQNGRVFAFEPLPSNIERARKTAAEHGSARVEIVPVALSDSEGEATFYVSSGAPPGEESSEWDFGNKSSSLLAPERHTTVVPWLKFEEKITVSTLRGDSFCAERNLKRVDFIHLDVQGAEKKVLDGIDLEQLRVRAIWTEVAAVELYRGQPLLDDLKKYLAQRGYWLWRLDLEGGVSGDALFVRRSACLTNIRLAGAFLVGMARKVIRRGRKLFSVGKSLC